MQEYGGVEYRRLPVKGNNAGYFSQELPPGRSCNFQCAGGTLGGNRPNSGPISTRGRRDA